MTKFEKIILVLTFCLAVFSANNFYEINKSMDNIETMLNQNNGEQ